MTTDRQAQEVEHPLAKEHQELEQECDRLLALSLNPGSDHTIEEWSRALLDQLSAFKGQLLSHFHHEEEGGFLRDVLREVPNVERRVQTLRLEHGEMASDLDAILATLRELDDSNREAIESVQRGVRTLVETLRHHEIEEQHLVQRTYYREHGGGD
jgi:hemerythrin-like domain-containing protein